MFVLKRRTCLKILINFVKILTCHFKIKLFNHSILLCCADIRLLNNRHENVNMGDGRIGFGICTVALPCLLSKNSWEREIVDCITCCCHPSKERACSLSLNFHDNEDDSTPSPKKFVLQRFSIRYNFSQDTSVA